MTVEQLLTLANNVDKDLWVCECCGVPSHPKFMTIQSEGPIICRPCASFLDEFDVEAQRIMNEIQQEES